MDTAADRLFATIDTDKNGSLSKEELLDYLLGAGVEHEEIARIFAALDADSDGKITPDEWRAGYARYVSPTAALMSGMRQYTSKAALEAARRDAAAGEADDVALIDAQWLLKFDTSAGGPPCRQQLPVDAFFAGSVDADDVEVLSISYPWLTKTHPDPEGWHLKIVQYFLNLYFTMENKGQGKDCNERTLPPAGAGKRVAVFWDWMSLFQEHNPSGRTDAQTASFKRALQNINIWYASSTTMVWRLTKLPPAPRPGHDIKPYEFRGWCFFELAVGEMITPGGRVLDLGLAVKDDGTCFEARERRADERSGTFFSLGKGGWVAAEDDPHGEMRPTVAQTCSGQRKFPIGAAAFSDVLDGKGPDGQARVFTNGADAEFVKGKYADTFKAVVGEATELNLANLLLVAPLAELAPALEMCGPRLRVLDLSKNTQLTGGLEALGACAVLETLKLHGCSGLTGDLGPLQGLTQLTHLDLFGCRKLTGDSGSDDEDTSWESTWTEKQEKYKAYAVSKLQKHLAEIQEYIDKYDVKLEKLRKKEKKGEKETDKERKYLRKQEKRGTEKKFIVELIQKKKDAGDDDTTEEAKKAKELARSDLGPLQGLTQLTYLCLRDCKGLTGDLGPLQGLTQLTYLDLYYCEKLTGDLGPLQGLTQLTYLNLGGTFALTGDKKGLMEARGVRTIGRPRA